LINTLLNFEILDQKIEMENNTQEVNIKTLLEEISFAANESISEEDVKIRIENIFREHIYKKFNIKWGRYELTLKSGVRPDALYGKVIIDYKKPRHFDNSTNVKNTINQIQNYIMEQAQKEESYGRYFGVAIDGFKIIFTKFRKRLNKWEIIGPNDINKDTIFKFIEAVRGLQRKKLNATLLTKDFGPGSKIASNVLKVFYKKVENPSSERTKMLFDEWKRLFTRVCSYSIEKIKGIEKNYRFLSKIDEDKFFFVLHSYYAILMKCLAAEIATLFGDSLLWSYLTRLKNAYLINNVHLKNELFKLEQGGIFSQIGITNFLEADFFDWYLYEWDLTIANALIQIIDGVAKYEPGTVELEPDDIRDIFKELYEDLVPQDIRHNLGEYYTPDWVAELILKEKEFKLEDFNPKNNDPLKLRFLDPACGSGTFIVTVISKIKEILSEEFYDNVKGEALAKITKNIIGFDLNPLAVLTARTTYLLGIADYLRYRKSNIEIPIYLADSIFTEREGTLEGEIYKLYTGYGEFIIPTSIVQKELLGNILLSIEESISSKQDPDNFIHKIKSLKLEETEINIVKRLYSQIFELEKKQLNTIWTRIIKNAFAPLLQKKFDFIIGNPPWLSYRYIGNVEYQGILKKMITDEYKLSKGSKLTTQMELATLFYIRTVQYYLKKGGIISFLMPRGIMSGDQHHKFRTLDFEKVNVDYYKIIDLKDVDPLFNIASCIIFGEKEATHKFPIIGYKITGKLPRKNISLILAKKFLKFEKVKFQLYQLGQRSWIDEFDPNMVNFIQVASKIRSEYYKDFFQGASIVPRSFFLIDIIESEFGMDYSKPLVQTSKRAKKMAKADYKDVNLQDNIESEFLYGVFTSTELIPFGFLEPCLTILPIMNIDGNYQLISSEQAKNKGFSKLNNWLIECERIWTEKRGDKADKYTIYDWINIQNKLTNQDPNIRFKVLYPTSATYLISSVIDTKDSNILNRHYENIDIELQGIIIDTKCYHYETDNEDEAYYLCAILNSNIIDNIIKPMQSQGKWGPRDIHKKVLEIPIPKFISSNSVHNELSSKGKEISLKVLKILPEILKKYEEKIITGSHIGRIRSKIKEQIEEDINDLDELVLNIFQQISEKLSEKTLDFFLKK